jgi:adenylate cyclase
VTTLLERLKQIKVRVPELGMVLIAGSIVTGFVLIARHFRVFQVFELVAYDRFVQMRASNPVDNRLLVIGITEQDLQRLGGKLQLPDQVYAQLLAKLRPYNPRAIGLDIYRDLPIEPGHAELVKQFKASDRIIGITRLGDEVNPTVAPPSDLPTDQVGFNDATQDVGGVVRRSILYQQTQDGEILQSFSLRLAERYLLDEGIEPQENQANDSYLQLGQATIIPLGPDDGNYVNEDVGGYQIQLNYRGRSKTIPFMSLGEILNEPIDPNLIRDRVVLIGTTATSGNDFAYTPYSSDPADEQENRMAGVVVHAQMVSQLLDAAAGKPTLFWYWSDGDEALWILSWSIVGGLLAWRIRHPLLVALSIACSLGILFIACRILFEGFGWIPLLPNTVAAVYPGMGWVPFIPPGIALLFSSGSIVTYTAQQAQQQRRMVMRLLGQSTSPQIAETLWQRRDELLENGKLPGQKLIATLLFTDLRGFSQISERHPPEVLFTWLNDYLEQMTEIIQARQGVINKFTGDGIMAVFGVPIPHDLPLEIAHDAEQAVLCAIEMADCLENLNRIWMEQERPMFQMRVGIFTGPVVVGSLGSKIRLEYGVIGDSVNTASRLESLDKERQSTACRILIARQTLEHLPDQFQVESWGALPLKGKEERIEVYEVLGKKPETND